MKTITNKTSLTENLKGKKGLFSALALMAILFLTSCEKHYYHESIGHDGHPGNAYLSITWVEEEPEYLDAGTSAIPGIFEWGRYYIAYPGYYTMYYDGSVWTGKAWADYAWEIDYEIWINEGEHGGSFYDGRDGADNYFTLECSPYGPDVYSYNAKSINNDSAEKKLSKIGNEIVINKKDKIFSMKITYKCVAKRNS